MSTQAPRDGSLAAARTEVDPPLSSRGTGYAPTVTPDVLDSQVNPESTMGETSTLAFLLASSVMLVVTTLMYVGWTRDQLERLERRAQIQSWHFHQLAPDDARAALKRPTVPPPGCAMKPA